MKRLPTARRHLSLLLLILAGLAWMGARPAAAVAHPLGNFTVNRYSRLELGPEQVQLLYVVDMAEIPAFQEQARIDADGDGTISPSEEEQYLASQVEILASNLQLTIGGAELPLELREQTLEFPPGQGGLLTLRLTARFVAGVPRLPAPWDGQYRDGNYAGRLGWQEVVVRSSPGATLLASSAPGEDRSQELRDYPQDLLESPPTVSSASFRFAPGLAGTAAPVGVEATEGVRERAQERFAALVAAPTLGPSSLLLALVGAFVLGAGHALSPGHGKTVVAAYLVGSRGTARHALFLGLTTTITHTAGVFALGIVTLFLSNFILPERLYPWLGVVSGVLVCTVGLSLLNGRLGRLLGAGAQQRDHSHGDGQDDGHHHHGYGHHHHGPGGHSHAPPGTDGSPVTWRSLLVLGVSGGLLPCPSALVVLLSAIALQRVTFGLVLIVAFSLGLAAVLTGIGILLVHAGRLVEGLPVRGRLFLALPVVSALFVTLAGIGITLRALVETGLL
ncbi:MAG TPA: sulfite exporter TauE/SafE family protein [Ardenticatenaceae bacterium]|nr:sulfite exporter TauE/SafE family protein [Ardenticatenaceae bacterium]